MPRTDLLAEEEARGLVVDGAVSGESPAIEAGDRSQRAYGGRLEHDGSGGLRDSVGGTEYGREG